jgi:hypothetical protein
MRVIKSPTDPIFYDAYLIADAIVYQQDQEARLQLAIKRDGIMSNKVARLSNDIVRLSALIQDRIAAWDSSYSSTGNRWHQYITDFPKQHRIKVQA